MEAHAGGVSGETQEGAEEGSTEPRTFCCVSSAQGYSGVLDILWHLPQGCEAMQSPRGVEGSILASARSN